MGPKNVNILEFQNPEIYNIDKAYEIKHGFEKLAICFDIVFDFQKF